MLPPVVVYIHGETAGVPLKFRFNNPPYWFADDVMGHLVLAGHGTFTNNCVSEAALLDATLGVVGTSKPEMPVPYLFPTDMCPSPGTTYNSVRDIDIVKFTIPGAGTVSVRNFVHSNILNPINPPPVNTSATYNFSNSVITAELSLNPAQWLPVQGNGPMAAMIRHGSNDTSNTRLFDTEMLQLNIAGNSPIGAFRLRESPTRQSLGKHTIRTAPQGFLITSFFDVFLDLSTDNGTTWIPADRAVHMAVDTAPPCGVGAVLHMTRSGTAATLYWSDTSYMLQFRPSFATTATWATLPGSSSPMTVNIGNQSGYYRLVCK